MKRLALAFFVLLLAATGGFVGQAASSAQSTCPATSSQAKLAAVVDNNIWVNDPAAAETEMQRVVANCFNAVGVVVPYSPGQAEIKNDRDRICAAAVAAARHNVKFYITIEGVMQDHRPGFVPVGSGVRKFVSAVMAYVWNLASDQGCVPDVSVINLEVYHEINSQTFWRPQKDGTGNWAACGDYARFMARVYPAVQQAVARLNELQHRDVHLNIIGAGLTSAHDPLGCLKVMGAALRDLRQQGFSGPLWDTFSYHPYGQDSGDPPADSFSIYDRLVAALKQNLGWAGPILYSEYGVETVPQPGKGYKGQGGVAVSEVQQADFYRKALAITACQAVQGLFIFHLDDDQQLGGWQSGLYYPDQSPKSSQLDVRQAVIDYLSGSIASCQQTTTSGPAIRSALRNTFINLRSSSLAAA